MDSVELYNAFRQFSPVMLLVLTGLNPEPLFEEQRLFQSKTNGTEQGFFYFCSERRTEHRERSENIGKGRVSIILFK